MRILLVHNNYRQPGGEDKAFALEADLLKAKGHAVETLVFSNDAIATTGLRRLNELGRAIYNPGSKKQMVEAIRRFRPDVVHIHNLFFAASPSILDAAKLSGIPVVMTLHNYRLICCNALLMKDGKPCELCKDKKLPAEGIRYRCYRGSRAASTMVTLTTGLHKVRNTWATKVSKYIVLTKFAQSRFSGSSLGVPDSHLVVKANFIPDTGTGKAVRDNFFLFAGRLSVEKGIYPLMAAFSRMPDQNLVVAGEGPERKILEKHYENCSNIRFVGALEQPALLEQMRSCSALIFPSLWYEGLPFVILEAFCAGTPVIASRLGSMTDMIEDGVNGLHFTAGDEAGLIGAVQNFPISSADLYLGARKTYLARYHPDIHYRHIAQIYQEVVDGN